MKEINLYIDESGDLGKGNGRYFLICALEVDNALKESIKKDQVELLIVLRLKMEYLKQLK